MSETNNDSVMWSDEALDKYFTDRRARMHEAHPEWYLVEDTGRRL